MTQTIRAAVMRAPRTLEVAEFPYPELEPGAVLMRVACSGVCGTDKHTYRGETKQYAGTPHERELEYPLICGHENVGVVEAVEGTVLDSEGTPLRPGDRIVPGANVTCGRCYFCLNAFPYYYCEQLADYGNSLTCKEPPHLFGGWAESMVLLPGTKIFRVPDELPDEVAVLTEVMSVTHGLETARLLSGAPFAESVAIVGVGPLGLCHLIKARLLGCGKLIAIDRLPSRLALAEEFGATLTLHADGTDEEERLERVREHTGGRGADVVVDCSGVPETFPESLRLARFGGVVVEAGAFVDLGAVRVNPAADICTRNVRVLGVGGETATSYVPVMQLMARNLDRLPFELIVTHRFGLGRAQEALEVSQADGSMKVVIDPCAA